MVLYNNLVIFASEKAQFDIEKMPKRIKVKKIVKKDI